MPLGEERLAVAFALIALGVLLFAAWLAASAERRRREAGRLAIPNIVHFVYGMREQTEPFRFVSYVAVLSAFLVNEPEEIFLHYHYLPYGLWFDALRRDVPVLRLVFVELPTRFGTKPIKQTAHRADAVRMEVLRRHGGIYMDMDTISARPYHHLRGEEMVMGLEADGALCNAVMMSAPEGRFLRAWMGRYEEAFVTDGWCEASVQLPFILAEELPSLIRVLPQRTFFWPTFTETAAIFLDSNDIPEELLTLHLWDSYSNSLTEQIKDWSWATENGHTLYGKLLQHVWGLWRARAHT